jgi:hypothetical protein
MGYILVWPCLEVKLVYMSSFGVFTIMMDYELSEDVVRIGGLLEVCNTYVTIDLVLLNLRPVSSTYGLYER